MADILIVDDDADLAAVLGDLLRSRGHCVRTATDGREGLAALAERLPDLVVLDVEMPFLDGPGMVYQMLLDDVGRERIPILLSSGYIDLPKVAVRVGTPYFVGKPCPVALLIEVLGRALVERTPPRPTVAMVPHPAK